MFTYSSTKSGTYLNLLLILSALLSISACSKSDSSSKSSQVAAKVDGVEISIHQLNQLLATAPEIKPEDIDKAKKQALAKLVDQQLVVNKAMKDNLDRSPEVMMALEASKRDILARAYLSKLVSTKAKISDSEVRKYYDSNPSLFSARQIYTMQIIDMQGLADSSLAGLIQNQKSVAEVVEYLKSKGINYSTANFTKPAEQIPLNLLPKLQGLQQNQTIIINDRNSSHIVHIIRIESAPIQYAESVNVIRNYLVNTEGKSIVESELDKLRKQSKIEYVGDFSSMSLASSNSQTTAESASVSKNQESSEKAKVNSSIEKGVAGLK